MYADVFEECHSFPLQICLILGNFPIGQKDPAPAQRAPSQGQATFPSKAAGTDIWFSATSIWMAQLIAGLAQSELIASMDPFAANGRLTDDVPLKWRRRPEVP